MIEIQDVSKQFDCVTALRHLTLKVPGRLRFWAGRF